MRSNLKIIKSIRRGILIKPLEIDEEKRTDKCREHKEKENE